jgi:hypothetical protein
MLKKYEQKSLMAAGARLSESDIAHLTASLNDNLESLSNRFKLIGFHKNRLEPAAHSMAGVPPNLFQQICWLVKNAPTMPMFSELVAIFCLLDREQQFELYKLFLDAWQPAQNDVPLVENFVMFLNTTGQDKELRARLSAQLAGLKAAG